jgi:FkbM family methyltransferase
VSAEIVHTNTGQESMRKILFQILQKLGYTVISNIELGKLRNDLWVGARNSSLLYFLSQLTVDGLTRLRQVSEIIGESKSQLGQDILALSLVGLGKPGYFVEFGATNGVDLSNTYMLERYYGWKGILCEPARSWHSELFENRSSIIYTRCVFNSSGEVLEFSESIAGELSTLVDFIGADHHAHARINLATYKVTSVTLKDLLDEHRAPSYIDFISIDTEGSEYQILNEFDFEKYRFGLICVEHNFTENRDKLFLLLSSNGYTRVFEELSQWDDWYVSKTPNLK